MSDDNTPQIKYDVFVSFRGKDIRRRFLSHLTKAFERKQINAFVDDRLERGEEIWPSLVREIETSFISLIIFSPNYASSRWCLEELVKILECREKHKRIVIPVFYNVEPIGVRHQLGSYKNAFAEHGKKYMSKVQIWRDALQTCASLPGVVSYQFQNDAKLLEEIVNNVLMKLRKPPVTSKRLVGIDEKIATIESWIREEPKENRLIGIWGMDGIGKTTLAVEIFQKLRHEYEGCCFLAYNERKRSRREGLISLKKEIFSQLLEYDVKVDTLNSLPEDIVRRISCMKVLIVLDDVNDSEHVEKLLESLDDFGSGSRIIVTTRDEQVLKANKVDKTYQLKGFSPDKALELFNLDAFKQSDHQREYNELSEKMVDYAQGIPLALKVLASFLHGKNKEEWENMLDKLKKVPPTKVHDVMKLSYYGLDRKGKQIFLDLACFFLRTHEPVNVGCLKSLLKDNESDNSVAFELGKLKDKALITFSEHNLISMHDSLQEMAWEIVRQESIEDPGSRSWLWNPDDTYEALKDVKGIESIRSILLHWPSIKKQKLSPHIVAKMSRLQFLEIDDILGSNAFCPKWQCLPKWQSARIVDILAEGLQFLATELRYLCWYQYPLKSLPENFSAEKLVILKFPRSRMEKLWHGVKNLMNLKEVDLTKSKKLKELPDLSKATNLEVLILSGCSKLTSVHPSVFSLGKLEKFDLRKCKSLTILASNSNLRSLSYLNLDFCKNLVKFSLISENMKELRLGCTKIKTLPSSFGHQSKLKLLHLEESGIEWLPSSFYNLTQLLHLDVSFCEKLQTIAELPPSLEILNVQYCTSLQTIPKLPPSLKTLNAESCNSLKTLPELPASLETLNAELCHSLQTIAKLPQSLQTLNVQCCCSLKTIPVLPAFLKTLYAENCTLLQNLPELPRSLETLNATYCKSLKTVLFPSTAIEQLEENRKRLLFWNCSNLDERSLVAIGLNVLINVMKFANQHLSTPNHNHVENYNDYQNNYHSYQAVYVYPGRNVPEWLEYKTTNDYIIIDLSYAPPSPLFGFIFNFILGEFQHTDIIRRLAFNITISDGEGEGKKDSVRMYIDYYWDDTIESDNVCVMYDQRCTDFLNSRAKNQTRFKIEVTMEALSLDKTYYALPRQVLKGFGVSPISTSACNSFVQQMEFHDSMHQFH